ncbi:hypothetical protein LH991_11115 [Schleiferilactobacillus harbinensis]|uniref:Uncharacterized protein n=1 Tax=Schleiferilactobacillus harbinensis DSM 16991 TaxID=1122147 RepID=A0A0R1XC68_9LACO|nr:hypothetical protein [Schleiferilactobacillus harbinensis]KRM27269.1 hypothetical protein FC91_GL002706 [Schleiferilactobacillus harbinensis DSM 16991]MCT2907677.1 hypothetical protein [Schleiferilactobacillus harbinensis]QFR64488.1 hypothetical protein LH991_11115 [Schleiferilactobacillus harbinensis]GEK06450.1 hypothetical protein LHA01_16890 [Schleiferilactobacillus harbinensis]
MMVFEGDAGKIANRADMNYQKRFGKYPPFTAIDKFMPNDIVLRESVAKKYAEYLASLSEPLPNDDPPDRLY